MERISAMKRFVVIMWDLNAFTNINLLKDDNGNVMIFPRRKEARDYMQRLPTREGFTYRTTSIHV